MTPPLNSARLDRLLLRQEIDEFNVAYGAVLDAFRLEEWPDFFTEDGFYLVTARENHEAGLPVGLIYCEGRPMLRDRAFALQQTAMFAPRYLRHVVAGPRLLPEKTEGAIEATANYVVLQTLADRPETRIHQAGTYHDRFVRDGDRLKLASRICVYDNLLLDTSLVCPI